MPSTFHGIHMSSGALRAFQYGMDIAGHNLANVNTRGYTRQTVEYKANDPLNYWFGRGYSLGQGVSISSINRIRDDFLEFRMQSAMGDVGRQQTLATSLSQVEPVFNEPGSDGIAAALDKFFNSWSSLASNPSAPASRLEVQQAGQKLADRIRTTFGDLRTRQSQLSDQMTQSITDINQISSRIADLNAEIRRELAVGGTPNDLMDQRDNAVRDLAQLVNVTTSPLPTGEVTVHFGGYPLVDVAGDHAFPANLDASTFSVSDGTYSYPVRGGALFGMMEASQKISNYMSRLDTLANTLREEINTPHLTGMNANGTTGIHFFNQSAVDPQNGAIDFDLSPSVKADAGNISAGITGSPGDGGLALAFSQLRDNNLVDLGNKSFSTFYSQLIADVGFDTQHAQQSLDTVEAIVQQVESQQQAVSGVSIDDEMANMIKLQRSYQAAAKTLSIFDQMTEEILGLVR